MVVTDVHGYAFPKITEVHMFTDKTVQRSPSNPNMAAFVFLKVIFGEVWSVKWDPNVTSSRLFQKSFENNPQADLSSRGKSDAPSRERQRSRPLRKNS